MGGRRGVVGLLLFAAALRIPMFPLRRLVEGDGVHYAHLARSILAADFSGLANPYWSNLWPAVMALTSGLTGLDVVTAGRLASFAAGVVLVVLTAFLATRVFGPTPGLIAGLLAAVHPWLIHFSTLVFSESFFACLLAAFLLAALAAGRSGGRAARAGLLGGLALWTRPEAWAAVGAAMLWLPTSGAARPRVLVERAALVAGIVGLFAVGRGYAVHRYHGIWDFGIGTKGGANLLVGLAETDSEKERVRTEVGPSGENVLARAAGDVSVVGFALAHPMVFGRHVGRNLLRLAASASRVFPIVPLVGGRPALWQGGWSPLLALLTIATCGLAAMGAWWAWRGGSSWPPASLLLVTGVLYALGLASLEVHDRLVVPLVPLFLVFLAQGLAGSARILVRSEPGVRWLLGTAVVLAGLLSLARLLRAPALDYAAEPVVQRETGEWLAAHYGQDTRIMTASPSVGFYFHDAAHAWAEIPLPWESGDRLLEIARQQGVRLLVIPEWHLRAVHHPAAALLDPEAPPPGLRHVATLGDDARGRMFVYEVQPPPGLGSATP